MAHAPHSHDEGKDRYWVRCVFCGDSENELHAHLSISLRTGYYRCVRCDASGKLTPRQFFELLGRLGETWTPDLEADAPSELPILTPGPGQPRHSALDRYHFEGRSGIWDAFQVRSSLGEVVGIYGRLGKRSHLAGESGLGFCGSELTSSQTAPIRLVEGPYDVLLGTDACCFGSVSKWALSELRGQFVILCPDGDVWSDRMLRRRFYHTLRLAYESTSCYLVGLEVLPDDLDPDEIPVADRPFVPRKDLGYFLKNLKRSLQ